MAFTIRNWLNNTEPTFLHAWLQLNGLRNAIHNMLELHTGEGLSLMSQQIILDYKQEIRSANLSLWYFWIRHIIWHENDVFCVHRLSVLRVFLQAHSSAPWLRARKGPNSAEEHRQSLERAQSTAGIPGLHQHTLQTLHQEVRTAKNS